jgi:hypothetical protein
VHHGKTYGRPLPPRPEHRSAPLTLSKVPWARASSRSLTRGFFGLLVGQVALVFCAVINSTPTTTCLGSGTLEPACDDDKPLSFTSLRSERKGRNHEQFSGFPEVTVSVDGQREAIAGEQ